MTVYMRAMSYTPCMVFMRSIDSSQLLFCTGQKPGKNLEKKLGARLVHVNVDLWIT